MTDLRKAAEMALEVLMKYDNDNTIQHYVGIRDSITALSQALAQPSCQTGAQCLGGKCPQCVPTYEFECPRCGHCCQQREWVGLTEEEFFDLLSFDRRLDHVETPLIADFIRTIQAKLNEKNT